MNKIVIVGAGIIGVAAALTLQREGHNVLLIDRDSPCSGASFGNAGAIVNGSCVPTAMPGILLDVFKMIGRPLSPLTIRPAYLHKILPWLIRFVWQSRRLKVENNSWGLYNLSKNAVSDWRHLTHQTPLANLLRDTGWLKIYESSRAFDGTKKNRQLHDQANSPYEILSPLEISDLEPNLAPIFKHGFYQKDSLNISNPEKLVVGMVDLFIKSGGKYQQFSVESLNAQGDTITVHGPTGALDANKIIIAAGAWSKTLAKQLGDHIPLDTERGYHLMFPQSTSALLKRPVVNGENSFVLAPMETGMRLTSQIEFAGIDANPNYSRVRSLVPTAKRMLPSLDTNEESVWMGGRPSLPDSLPVIGFSKRSQNILYAFGHQHLGMTLGATTATIISDLVNNKTPEIPMAPYSADRF